MDIYFKMGKKVTQSAPHDVSFYNFNFLWTKAKHISARAQHFSWTNVQLNTNHCTLWEWHTEIIRLYKRIYKHKIKCPQRGASSMSQLYTFLFTGSWLGRIHNSKVALCWLKMAQRCFLCATKPKGKKKKSAFFYNRMFIPFILPPCERVFPLGILECIKQQ